MLINTFTQPNELNAEEFSATIRSLNKDQRDGYEIVLNWFRNKVKSLTTEKPSSVNPLCMFVTGGAGTRKSHLIKAIYQTAVKTFKHTSDLDHASVLLAAPTGVAAVSIDGSTINTALAIPKNVHRDHVSPLSDQRRSFLREKLSQLKLIIIDEVSMVSNIRLKHIHDRLTEIFATPNTILFAGLSVIVVGDFYQLAPIRARHIFAPYRNDLYNLCHPWFQFKMIELTEIMRQIGDTLFAQILGRIRVARMTEDDIETLSSRFVKPTDQNYPHEALHIFAENALVDKHNNKMLSLISKPSVSLIAHDHYPQNVPQADIDKALSRNRTETGGLDCRIDLKEDSKVMLTSNLDTDDHLINGQMGKVAKIKLSQTHQNPQVIYVKFDDEDAGRNTISKSSDSYAIVNHVVPIVPVLAHIKINNNRPSSPEIQRTQFPLTLAWACTVHKVQGLTLDKVVFSFELFKQKSFNFGQVYVALTRVKTLVQLFLTGEFDCKHIKADPRVDREYERLRSPSMQPELPDVPETTSYDSNVVITLLNIRSLRKHSLDIKLDNRLLKSDILAFTETQLKPTHIIPDVEQILCNFNITRHDNNNSYLSLALCTDKKISQSDVLSFPQVNGFSMKIVKNEISLRLLLLYRPHSYDRDQFVYSLHDIISTYNIEVVIDDFNLNYFSDIDCHDLKYVMNASNYTQLVSSATYVSSGSLLDHVYIKSHLIDSYKVDHVVKCVYYSDHDSIKISICLKDK